MNNLYSKADDINKELKEMPLVKEYLHYKELLENDETLTQMKNKILFLQKCNPTDEEKEEYFKLKKEYENNPIVANYNSLKKDIKELKDEVRSLLKIWFMQF